LPLAYHRVSPTGYAPMGKAPLVWTGIVLLLAFVLPIFEVGPGDAGQLKFPNLDASERSDALFAWFAAIYPALAGVTILLLAPARGPGRGIGVLVVALIPLVWAMVELVGAMDDWPFGLLRTQAVALMVGALLLIGTFGWMGLLVGAWVLRYEARARLGKVLAAVGGALYILAWLVPVVNFGSGSATWPAVVLIESATISDLPVVGRIAILLLVAQAAAMLAAGIKSIVYTGRPRDPRGLANWVFWTAILAAVTCALGLGLMLGSFYAAFADFGSDDTTEHALMVGMYALKFGAYALGLLLPLAVGLTDLLVALTPRTAEQVESSGA
jgi:hypothetical protein